MMLAFLIDQVQFLCCDLRKKLKKKGFSWHTIFENTRSMFRIIVWDSWVQLYELLLNPESRPPPNWYGVPISVNM
jgi:hypothetical protein